MDTEIAIVELFHRLTLTADQAAVYHDGIQAAREIRQLAHGAIVLEREAQDLDHRNRERDAELAFSVANARALAAAVGLLPPEVR